MPRCLTCAMTDPEDVMDRIPGAGWIHKEIAGCSRASRRPSMVEHLARISTRRSEPQTRTAAKLDPDPQDQDETVARTSTGHLVRGRV